MKTDGREPGPGIRLVEPDQPDYPSWLKRIYEPPTRLWVRGRLVCDEGVHSVAIVGSRAATPLGVAFTRMLAGELAAAGLTIVSGLARGIDAAAHQGALDAGGRTVAVLGSGLDRIYPREHEALARAIVKRGAVVSEFPPGTGPWKQNFPRRNRTIAGWSRATVVVEASERSGSLHTARAALEEGREVMAVPGHPSLPGAAGTNALLRDGAALVRGAADVLSELGLEPLPAPAASDDPLLGLLPRGVPMAVEALADRSGRPLPELLVRLTELELGGQLRRLAGAMFVRV
jgi:DNA processing protein